ncbi:MAG: hypothetical protein AAGH82_10590, partial [Pseudomonadota bacterium]
MLDKTPKDGLIDRKVESPRLEQVRPVPEHADAIARPARPSNAANDVQPAPATEPVETASLGNKSADSELGKSKWSAVSLVLRISLQLILMVAVLGTAIYFMRGLIASAPEPRSRPVFQTVFTVEATEVVLSDNQPIFSVFGTVTAARDVELRALSPGEVTAVSQRLQAGQRVEAGELLVEVDTFEYEGALAE